MSAADVGNNFFIDPNGCLGNSRAKVAAELLRELNQDVAGCHVDEVRVGRREGIGDLKSHPHPYILYIY